MICYICHAPLDPYDDGGFTMHRLAKGSSCPVCIDPHCQRMARTMEREYVNNVIVEKILELDFGNGCLGSDITHDLNDMYNL